MEEISSSSSNKLPPGFRFHPTDEELITYYLCNKISDFNFSTKAVTEVDLNKCEPWDLPAKATMGEKEWYFFSQRDRKYPTGLRTNRATEAGYWKTTGKDKEIFHGGGGGGGGQLVGMKKTLVFYRGRAPKGEKTNWVMHEYRLIEHNKLLYKPTKQDEWVVCRVFQKSSSPKRPQQTPSSPPSQGSPSEANAMISELAHDIELPSYAAMHPSSNYNPSTNLHTNIMNWPATAPNTNISPLAWPLLLTALQLRGGHHQQAGSGPSINPAEMMLNTYNTATFMPPTGASTMDGSQFGNDHFMSSFDMGSTSSVPHMPQQEQPYDIDPNIWCRPTL